MKECDAHRHKLAHPHHARPDAAKVVVVAYRHNAPHYFRKVWHTKYLPDGRKEQASTFFWELIPERARATRMTGREANALVDAWGARAIEEV